MNRITMIEKCTGCGTCMLTCDQNAILINEDSYGFLLPQIDQERCINCGKCFRVCPQNTEKIKKQRPIQCFAAQGESEKVLLNCASGGAFYYIARSFIEKGGIVFGCKMTINDDFVDISHIRIDDAEKLTDIIGSKYAQSNSYKCFREIQEELNSGRRVLFSGTPCQVAALKAFLSKEYDQLYTIDIFCHGNTNIRLLSNYFQYLREKEKSNIVQYIFRDKYRGKGYKAKYLVARTKKWRRISTYQEAYWYLFQKSKILRQSCYDCNYSSIGRIGDISLGDFWGIEKTRPDILNSQTTRFNNHYGISAVLVNDQKGLILIDDIQGLKTAPCNIEDISKYGDAISKAAVKPNDRENILADYVKYGYGHIQKRYKKTQGFQYYKNIIRETPIVEKIMIMVRSR